MKKTLITIIIILIVIFFFYPRVYVNNERGQTLASFFLFPGEEIIFKYTHSVEKTPVFEKYVLAWTGKLVMTETHFKSYGAGLPLETRNFSTDGGYFILKEMGIELTRIRIRVSRTPGQSITIRNKKLFLNNLAEPGQVIIIEPIPLVKSLAALLF